MQRAKHAGRKQETRRKILIGEAAMRAGASAMPVDELEAVLAHYVKTGGSKELRSIVAAHSSLAKGGSEATRRGDVEIEPMMRSETVLQ